MFQAVYKKEIWHKPQEEKGHLVLEEIILTLLITGLKTPRGSKKEASTQIKDSCNQDYEPSAWKKYFSL